MCTKKLLISRKQKLKKKSTGKPVNTTVINVQFKSPLIEQSKVSALVELGTRKTSD